MLPFDIVQSYVTSTCFWK